MVEINTNNTLSLNGPPYTIQNHTAQYTADYIFNILNHKIYAFIVEAIPFGKGMFKKTGRDLFLNYKWNHSIHATFSNNPPVPLEM